MKSLTPPRLIGLISGILIYIAYQFLTSAFVLTNIADILSGLGDGEIDFAHANLYILSGAVFLFVLVIVITTIQNLGEGDSRWSPSTRQSWFFAILMIAFLFLCFPLTILTRNILPTILLLASPVIGTYVGREIAKEFRQRVVLNHDQRRQAHVTWIMTFLILVGFFNAISA